MEVFFIILGIKDIDISVKENIKSEKSPDKKTSGNSWSYKKTNSKDNGNRESRRNPAQKLCKYLQQKS